MVEIMKPASVVVSPDINVVATEVIRDVESVRRREKLRAILESRQQLNPSVRKRLISALTNAAKDVATFGEQLSKDFEELPPTGTCYQRMIREQMAEQDEADITEKRRLAADFTSATVREITYAEAQPIILKYEYLGSMNASTKHSVGLFFGKYLAGVECFGSTGGANVAESVCGPEHADKVITLVRGACTGLWAHRNSASYLITRACKLMAEKGYNIIVAYADPRAEQGIVYRNCNWLYCGMTHPTAQFRSKDGKIHDSRQISGFTRDRRNGELKYRRTWAEERQLLVEQGCQFFMGEAKQRYVAFYGDRRTRSVLQKALQWKTYPYPKRQQPAMPTEVGAAVVGSTST
jgi:hypothetical protein